MRRRLLPFSLAAALVTLSACSDDKLSPEESVAVGCRAFVAIADTRGAQRAAARTALESARKALSGGVTPERLRALGAAEDAAIEAEVTYAQSPDVSLLGIAFAADADQTYQPVLTAFLSGDVAEAKAACSRVSR